MSEAIRRKRGFLTSWWYLFFGTPASTEERDKKLQQAMSELDDSTKYAQKVAKRAKRIVDERTRRRHKSSPSVPNPFLAAELARKRPPA